MTPGSRVLWLNRSTRGYSWRVPATVRRLADRGRVVIEVRKGVERTVRREMLAAKEGK